MTDVVDTMIARVRQDRATNEPLHVTCRRVWDAAIIDPAAQIAFREVGTAAIIAEGEPAEYPPNEGDNLAFIGFLAIAAENLIADDA